MAALYTYSEARQNLASLLDKAKLDGEVRIQRRDGQTFVLKPEKTTKSPLDVTGIDLALSRKEILDYIREGRRVYSQFEQ